MELTPFDSKSSPLKKIVKSSDVSSLTKKEGISSGLSYGVRLICWGRALASPPNTAIFVGSEMSTPMFSK